MRHVKQWLGLFFHNSVCHPLMPFLPRKWGDALHDWSARFLPSSSSEEERWWYFIRDGDALTLASEDFFTYRPDDATVSDNPHTPWYDLTNHFDDDHVHIQAKSYSEAKCLARAIVCVSNSR